MAKLSANQARRRSGFLLLEALPALFLTGAILIVGTGLFSVREKLKRRTHQQAMRQEAFLTAWRDWSSGTSRAVLLQWDLDGGWRFVEFPDDSWIPMQPDPLAGPPGGISHRFLFRRENGSPGDPTSPWRIEFLDEASGNWIWWATIIEPQEQP